MTVDQGLVVNLLIGANKHVRRKTTTRWRTRRTRRTGRKNWLRRKRVAIKCTGSKEMEEVECRPVRERE